MIILLDFDGTCVEHDFPQVGKDIGAVPVLKALTDAGHQLILFTVRSDKTFDEVVDMKDEGLVNNGAGNYLTHAVDWFQINGIPLYGIQTNPTQHTWSSSPKPYGNLIIDDIALGVPLRLDSRSIPCVNWAVIDKWFKDNKWYE